MKYNFIKLSSLFLIVVFLFSNHHSFAKKKKKKHKTVVVSITKDSIIQPLSNSTINIDGIIWFAKKQLGTPYKYASADPKNGGLDCSGFLYYVFQHFKISVPRSSKDYMDFGKTVSKNEAQKGDVIVFTGTDSNTKVGGHVGIVLENENGNISFIHGSSGKANGVTISKLSEGYYTQRFLKIVRVIK